jgi:predicted dehydrogenase
MERVRIGVAGAGYWGKNLVRTFATVDGSELVAIADGSDEIRARMARSYPGVELVENAHELFRRPDIDAVVLATPAATHAELTLEALAHGKDVFVEKPLALDTRAALEIQAATERSGRIVQVGHLLRYHPAVEWLDAAVQEGELGDLRYIYCRRVNLGRIRREENALWSIGPHDISIVLHLARAEPLEVVAVGESWLQPDVVDVVFLTLRLPDRRIAHIQLSWLDPHKDREITLVGSRRMVTFDDVRSTEKVRVYDKGFDRQSEYSTFSEFLSIRDGEIRIPAIRTAEPLAIEGAHFIECVQRRVQPRTDVAEGVRVVRVLEAAQRSMEAGGTRVRLDFEAATTGVPELAEGGTAAK